jgi:hypothetical protein
MMILMIYGKQNDIGETMTGNENVENVESLPNAGAEAGVIDATAVLLDNAQFKSAMQEFAVNNPWQGKFTERLEKFIQINARLNLIFNRNVSLSVDMPADMHVWKYIISDVSYKEAELPDKKRLTMVTLHGKLSVVSYLMGFGFAMGFDRKSAGEWAETVFKSYFPEQYAKTKVLKDDKGNKTIFRAK